MPEPELKPCPFCGRVSPDVVMTGDGHEHWVQCAVCDALGPIGLTEEEAVLRWSTRPEPEEATRGRSDSGSRRASPSRSHRELLSVSPSDLRGYQRYIPSGWMMQPPCGIY